jgi:hypothetical protein
MSRLPWSREFGADAIVHLLLAQDEKAIVGVVGDERQNVVEGSLSSPFS